MTKEKKQRGIGLGTGMILGIAVIYILFGLAMEFVPQFKEIYIIYIAGAAFAVFGIIMIVKYFLSGSYQDIGKYGFSAGVLCVLIGALMLVRSSEIAVYFSLFLGVCILLTAVVKLQNAVDLKSIHNRGWFVFLVIALAFLAVAILVVLNPGGKVSQYKDAIYYVLIADGIIDLISPIYLVFAIRASRRIRPERQDRKKTVQEKTDGKENTENEGAEHTDNSHVTSGRTRADRHTIQADTVDAPENKQTLSEPEMPEESGEEETDEMTKEILKFFEDEK